ncbi:MAG TPA: transcription termination/antitermination NusG family protein [Verrucomicrobiae bacterium]|nr:transcription termination/antitermination NusG family protein [Verrucomicrobiae bacterium]
MTRVDKQEAPLTLASFAEPIAWFCLRSQPRHEHIAARQLAMMSDVEPFNPRIRFARPTRHGPVWITESLFPNYLFARFDWREALNKVHYAPGVSGIVHFGARWPIVPATFIDDIRKLVGEAGVHEISKDLATGDKVRIAGGSLHGLEAVVTQVMPGQQRVAVLLDFLGRQTTVEVGADSIVKHVPGR